MLSNAKRDVNFHIADSLISDFLNLENNSFYKAIGKREDIIFFI